MIQDDIGSVFRSLGEGFKTMNTRSGSNLMRDLIAEQPFKAMITGTKSVVSSSELRYLQCSFFNAEFISTSYNDFLSSKPFIIFRLIHSQETPHSREKHRLQDWQISSITKLTSHLITISEQDREVTYSYNNVSFQIPVLIKLISFIETHLKHPINQMELQFHPISSSATASK